MSEIRVVLADSQTLFREGIKALLARSGGVGVVAEASTAEDALAESMRVAPDVVLMDVGMSGRSSFATCQQIRRRQPAVRVGFLTASFEDGSFGEYLASGASGYILKEATVAEFLCAIRTIRSGGSFLSAGLLNRISALRSGHQASELTIREREVLKMIAEGKSVKEVACILDLSFKTVDAHKYNLMRKLDIHNKAQLIQYAYQKKILNWDAVA